MVKGIGALRFMQIALQDIFGRWTYDDLDKAKAQHFNLCEALKASTAKLSSGPSTPELLEEREAMYKMRGRLYKAILREEERLDREHGRIS